MGKLFVIAASLAGALASHEARSWGDVGHRATGEVASALLTPAARAEVQNILGAETLAKAGIYPDEMRSVCDFAFAEPWHFVEIPIGKEYDAKERAREANAISKLEELTQVLKGSAQPGSYTGDRKGCANTAVLADRKFALRYVVHLVGDLHQPLHVGNGIDRGANSCVVRYFGRPTTLHALMDEGVIDSMKLGYTELAREVLSLQDQLLHGETLAGIGAGSYVDWAHESARLRPGVYPVINAADPSELKRPYCITAANYGKEALEAAENIRKAFGQPSFAEVLDELHKARIVSPKDVPHLGYEYRFEKTRLIKAQILKAGIRLARVLNTLFP